jgi:transposase
MTKYDEQFKLKIVKEYQEGKLGYSLLAKKYGIKSHNLIKKWIKVFDKFGVNGLLRKRNNEVYSVQFKIDVLDYMKKTRASLMDTALQFGITTPSLISVWNKSYMAGGIEALGILKGRPPMSNEAKNRNKKTNKEQEMTYEQKLERENELLRLEVEYLKKLRAFQMDPDVYLEKHKQRYHSNSKKPSN